MPPISNSGQGRDHTPTDPTILAILATIDALQRKRQALDNAIRGWQRRLADHKQNKNG